MPGLVAKAQVGEWLFVYNDDGAFSHRPVGGYVWNGQVLAVEHDDPDPKRCRYRIWGPGGEESNVVAGACLETRARAVRADDTPPAPPPGPLDEVLTPLRLADALDRAAVAVPGGRGASGPVVAAAMAAVRSLTTHWRKEAEAGRLTAGGVRRHLLDLAATVGSAADGFVAALAPESSPPPEGSTDAEE